MASLLPSIMPGAEPIFLKGGEIGVLCLHGITASPDEVRWLGEYLHAQGLTVYVARAAGHGADYAHLGRMRWEDWYLSALDGYHILRNHCQKIYVAGLSMGGLLALTLASNEYVEGVIAMAAPLILPDEKRLRRARWIKHLRQFLHMPDSSDFPERLRELQSRRGDPVRGRVRYEVWATQAIEELYELMLVARAQLKAVSAPTLLIYSLKDPTVPYDNLEYAKTHIGSKRIETHTLRRSGHILTQDVDHEEVFERAAAFILGKKSETE